jgi:hypothetical protein
MEPEGIADPLVATINQAVSISSESTEEETEDLVPNKRHYVGLPAELHKRQSTRFLHPVQIEEPAPEGRSWSQRFCPKLVKEKPSGSITFKKYLLAEMTTSVSGKKPTGKKYC